MTERHLASARSRWATVADVDHPIRVAILGAGKAASFHLEALDQIRGASLVGVCSRSGTSASALVDGRPGVHVASDPEDLFDHVECDAVIVAVSHERTFDVTRRVLSAGIPVLVEKPAGSSSQEVEELAELAESNDTLAVVGVNRRYYSLVQAARWAVLQRGQIRGVVVEGHESTDLLRKWGAVEPDLVKRWFLLDAVHYVDLIRSVGGEVADVSAVAAAPRTAAGDNMSASMSLESGGVATFVSHWNSGAPQVLRIYGDHVTAEVRLTPPERGVVEFTGGRRIALDIDPVDTELKPGVYAQDVAFLGAVASGRSPVAPASDLTDHAATMRLMEELVAGAAGS